MTTTDELSNVFSAFGAINAIMIQGSRDRDLDDKVESLGRSTQSRNPKVNAFIERELRSYREAKRRLGQAEKRTMDSLRVLERILDKEKELENLSDSEITIENLPETSYTVGIMGMGSVLLRDSFGVEYLNLMDYLGKDNARSDDLSFVYGAEGKIANRTLRRDEFLRLERLSNEYKQSRGK